MERRDGGKLERDCKIYPPYTQAHIHKVQRDVVWEDFVFWIIRTREFIQVRKRHGHHHSARGSIMAPESIRLLCTYMYYRCIMMYSSRLVQVE